MSNTSSNHRSKKLILVIGATGAQGQAVINSLLAAGPDGSPSPYTIRALTRNTSSQRAKDLSARGVEVVEGAFNDFVAVEAAFRGVYGAWVNTDGFTVGEQSEIYAGIRIFEIARQAESVRHFVWSNLDYAFKKGGYDQTYRCEHYDGKGRVGEWIQAQPSNRSVNGMAWSIVTSGPYMDMLYNMMFGPLTKREDGTFVFATPIGQGHVPMIALSDLGYWARYTFDNRTMTSGQELLVASDMVGWDYLVSTFQTVTGKRAVVVHQSLDEWFANFDGVDKPVANEREDGDGSTTWKENFSGWWSLWRDDVIKRDMDWIRSVHPRTLSLESWMRQNDYQGLSKRNILKNTEDGKTISPRRSRLSKL
ncbi:NAD(P)-binding protein [Trametopsis cervina]|nr:NAD(P)-binding protein [Trametopsis cervina]